MAIVTTLRIARVHERRRIHGAAVGSVLQQGKEMNDRLMSSIGFIWLITAHPNSRVDGIVRILASELPAGMHSFVTFSAVGYLTYS